MIQNLSDESYLKEKAEQLAETKSKYEKITNSSYPVVFALKSKESWFENWSDIGRFNIRNRDLRAKSNISPSSLLYRVHFINGTDGSLPDTEDELLPWNR